MSEPSETLWTPSVARAGNSQIQAFANEASRRTGLDLSNYSALHGWSVRELDAFWTLVWEMCEVVGDRGERPSVLGSQLTQSQFFPDARLNFAENCLRRRDDEVAIVFISESGKRRELSFADLYARVAKLAEWLRGRGVRAGDRVAACLPNLPDTIVAMLATSSLGGIWSSCSPDFGIDGVLDRFSQIEPKIIFCVDYYEYNGKRIETLTRVPEILAALPGVEACVIVPYAGRSSDHAREMAEIARPSPFSSARHLRRHLRRKSTVARPNSFISMESSTKASMEARRIERFQISSSSVWPSTIRSISCFPPVRPESRNASFTGRAGPCFST